MASWYWYRASAFSIGDAVTGAFGGKPLFYVPDADAAARSARLNKVAALWTAVSVLASTIPSILDVFSKLHAT